MINGKAILVVNEMSGSALYVLYGFAPSVLIQVKVTEAGKEHDHLFARDF
jgi:hypothetical protein